MLTGFIEKIKILVFYFILIVSTWIMAEDFQALWEELTISNGLSNNTVRCILQDSRGFLWFGTENGLNLYDGYAFKIYHHKIYQDNTISDSFIRVMLEDRQGNIWIGTDNGGLICYDWKTEKFTNYICDPLNETSLSENSISAIYESRDGTLWIGTMNKGFNRFNPISGIFIRYQHNCDKSNSLSNNCVRALVEDNDGYLWIGTMGGGLNRFFVEKNIFEVFYYYPNQLKVLSSVDINDLLIDQTGTIWIATGLGLNSMNPENNSFTRYYHDSESSSSIGNNSVNRLFCNGRGELWIGTNSGVDQYDINTNCFNRLPMQSERAILSLFEDSAGTLWFGTLNNGILKLNARKKKFYSYSHDASNSNSLSGNTIRSVYIDDAGNSWIGTEGKGLNYTDRETGKIRHFKYGSIVPNSINGSVISAIIKDRYGYMWIGSWGDGITKFKSPLIPNETLQDVTYYKKDRKKPNSIADNIIQDFFEGSHGNLWIGSNDGLDLYNRETDDFTHFKIKPDNPASLISNLIQSNAIVGDDVGTIWIGTWSGISRMYYNPEIEIEDIHFSNYSSTTHELSDNRVTCLLFHKGVLWAATGGGGLNKLIIESEQDTLSNFVYYSEEDGLPNNFIYSIVADDNDNLWLSTNHGLAKFNPESENFQNYFQSDGLLSNQFYWGAGCKDSDGNIYFGTINGLNSFRPGDIVDNDHIPPIIISDIQISNRSIYNSPEYQYLLPAIAENHVMELPFHHNSYSFEFVALDYVNPEKNKYAYILEGVDNNWVHAGRRRFVTYSNLKEGDYVFRVKGSNDDGLWNEEGTFLNLIIQPPFWRTWWFITIVAGIIIGNIGYIIYLKIRRYLVIEHLRQQIADDLHDNIGADLTEISIISEVLSRKQDAQNVDIQKDLTKIGSISRELVDSMSDIIWLVNPKRDSLYDLISRLGDRFSDLLAQTGISFRSENLDSLRKITLTPYYRQQLFLIFKEALNNSIKHSSCSEIILKTELQSRILYIHLIDNGKGFDMSLKYKGNGLENMLARSKQIKGELKIISVPGKGSSVTFRGLI